MPLPGFTAEVSLGPTTQAYRVQDRYDTGVDGYLHAQSSSGDFGDGDWDGSVLSGDVENGGGDDETFQDEGLDDDDDSMDMAAEVDEMDEMVDDA